MGMDPIGIMGFVNKIEEEWALDHMMVEGSSVNTKSQ